MRESRLIPPKLKEKLERQLISADMKISVNKLIINSLMVSLGLSIIILLFFRTELKLAPNFTKALINYYLISLLTAIGIVVFYVYSTIILKKNKRKKELEGVLADYLQLVATNLNAGMPIDQAMWYAVRERFGILAKEVEIIARKVMGGEDLEQALIEFTYKYDSEILKRSIMLLIEGLKSGGELSSLVDKISWNIKQSQILEKEINAETTTYTIFIVAASIIIAPFLYALSHRIIIVMSDIMNKINLKSISGLTSNLPLNFTAGDIISVSDFKIFIFINLFMTSIFCAMIISLIKTGKIKEGLKLMPIYLVISFVLFLLMSIILTSAFKGVGL
jgi:Flp pilus assembly protein TadB